MNSYGAGIIQPVDSEKHAVRRQYEVKFGKFQLMILIGLSLFLGVLPVSAQEGGETTERDQAFENKVLALLAEVAPQAVPIFQQATQAMDAGDFVNARSLYHDVLELAPDFPPALRRISYVELQLGRVEGAVYYADKAYQLDPSPDSALALAAALFRTTIDPNVNEAYRLTQEALKEEPDSFYANLIMRDIAAYVGDLESLRLANEKLLEAAPNDPVGYYYIGLLAAQDEEWEAAEKALLKAQELGLPEEQIQKVMDEKGIGEKVQEIRTQRYMRWGVYALVAVLGVGLIIFGVRWAKSRNSDIVDDSSPEN